jgi:hypothetical protein
MAERPCFLLFMSLLVLFVATAFLMGTAEGRAFIGLLDAIVLVTAVGATARSRVALLGAVVLAVPTLAFQIRALISGESADFAVSWAFGAAFYAYTIGHLLTYVLHRDAMTADKLYGAIAAYIMLALFWALTYGVLQYFYPGAYAYQGAPRMLDLSELIFFSFAVFTTAGFGDITPTVIQSRFLTIVEAVTGIMYVAILIARLTGVYPIATASPGRASPIDK